MLLLARCDDGESPKIHPFRSLDRHIYAAMAFGVGVIVMPICAVECDPGIGEIGYPWNAKKLAPIGTESFRVRHVT